MLVVEPILNFGPNQVHQNEPREPGKLLAVYEGSQPLHLQQRAPENGRLWEKDLFLHHPTSFACLPYMTIYEGGNGLCVCGT